MSVRKNFHNFQLYSVQITANDNRRMLHLNLHFRWQQHGKTECCGCISVRKLSLGFSLHSHRRWKAVVQKRKQRRVRRTSTNKEKRHQSPTIRLAISAGRKKNEENRQENRKRSLSRILCKRAERQSLSHQTETGRYLGQSPLSQMRQALCG